MGTESMKAFPLSTAWGETSLRTSRPYSDFPMRLPRAIAIGNPIIPVPGMPTPIAFLIILPLRPRLISSGCIPKSSVALATASDTAMGSVQPSAGTTSRRIKEIIFSLVALSIMLGLLVEWIMMTHTLAVFD